MDLENISYQGPEIDDGVLLSELPELLVAILEQVNGFVQHGGGLHFRGVCTSPKWHSLREVWRGENAFHTLYPDVRETDIPFAQDCVGDQFLLRDGAVVFLMAETGEIEPFSDSLEDFLHAVSADPVEVLSMEPLLAFQESGQSLEPGELLHAHPPFCTEESATNLSLRNMPALELIGFHALLSDTISNMPEGAQLEFEVA